MQSIDQVFERATIRGIVDYLLFGIGPDADDRSYEERLEEPYTRFEEEVAKHDPNPGSKLLDLSNELTSETASVYTEIGLQIAMVLMKDVIKNLSGETHNVSVQTVSDSSAFHANATILEGMYKERVERALKEVLEKDEKYCRVNEETNQKIKEIDQIELTKEEWEIIDTALSAANARSAEYGRVSYQQGFLDAVSLLRK